MSARLDFPWR